MFPAARRQCYDSLVPSLTGPQLVPLEGAARQLGRFELLTKLASGGMASVFLGRATAEGGFQRLVAIKRCHPHLVEDEELVAMFLDEARLAALIRHPNVVSVVDVSTQPEPYLVMDWVEGGALVRLLAAAARTPQHRVATEISLRIALDVLAGLHAAHEVQGADGAPLNLIHRDLSPQNVLVGIDGLARITDFGIARAEARLRETSGVVIRGKASYMSPEQIEGRPLDRRADVFSAGVVLWECLTGRRLFVGDASAAILHAVLHAPIPAPSVVTPGAPRVLDPVVLRALARDADARYPSALAFAEALEAAAVAPASHRGVGALVQHYLEADLARVREAATSSVVLPGPTPAPRRRRRWRMAAVSAALVLAGGTILALALRDPAPGPRAPAIAYPDARVPVPVVEPVTSPDAGSVDDEVAPDGGADAALRPAEMKRPPKRKHQRRRPTPGSGEYRPTKV